MARARGARIPRQAYPSHLVNALCRVTAAASGAHQRRKATSTDTANSPPCVRPAALGRFLTLGRRVNDSDSDREREERESDRQRQDQSASAHKPFGIMMTCIWPNLPPNINPFGLYRCTLLSRMRRRDPSSICQCAVVTLNAECLLHANPWHPTPLCTGRCCNAFTDQSRSKRL